MTKIDHHKQAQRDRSHAIKRDKAEEWLSGRGEKRAMALLKWVLDRNLVCFKCHSKPRYGDIAKTGISRRGAWWICVHCVKEKKQAAS